MGMTIDNSCEPKPMSKEEIVDTLKTMVFGVQAFERFNAKEREAFDKAWNLIDQYENRLKADMAAMLVELDLTIDEIPIVTRHGVTGTVMTAQGMRKKIKENIQQKIDALKE